MAFCLVCLLSGVLLLASISSEEVSTENMCQNRTTRINSDVVGLFAAGPSTSSTITNTLITCSCSINVTSSSNKVLIEFSRIYSGLSFCKDDTFDEAILYYTNMTNAYSHTLLDEDLSSSQETYENISAMSFDVTIYSFCGPIYTILLTENSPPKRKVEFSSVTCSNPKTVATTSQTIVTPNPASASSTKLISMPAAPSSSTSKPAAASPTAVIPTHIAEIDQPMLSTNSPTETYSSRPTGSFIRNDTSGQSQTGLIVGVVVGVGVGLLLLGAIILAVFFFRRRRVKHQPLTNANHHTAPTENPYEPSGSSAPVSYEEIRTQQQPGTLYDNQTAAVETLTTETNQNYYNVRDIDDGAIHSSYAATNGEVDNFAQEAQSVKDTDTTVIENELYGK